MSDKIYFNIFVLFNKIIRLWLNLPKMLLFRQLFEMRNQSLWQLVLILDFLDLVPIYLLVLQHIHLQLLNLPLYEEDSPTAVLKFLLEERPYQVRQIITLED